MNVFRARVFQLINEALVADGLRTKSWASIIDLDRQLLEVMNKLPWYFQLEAGQKAKRFPSSYDFLTWQNHILRTCVSTQRIRMYRPFLTEQNNVAFQNCAKAVEDALAVYRCLRGEKGMSSQQKFYPQAYQIFSVAVTMASLLLVERGLPESPQSRLEIQAMASDLGLVETQKCPVPVAVNGRKILLRMLTLFEQGESCSPEDTERLVPDISIILGGENSTRAYLGRRTVQTPEDQLRTPSQAQAQTEPAQQEEQSTRHQQIGGTGATSGLPTPHNGRVEEDDLSFMQFSDTGGLQFDFDGVQLSDSYDLFGWDMTGLLSDAMALHRDSEYSNVA